MSVQAPATLAEAVETAQRIERDMVGMKEAKSQINAFQTDLSGSSTPWKKQENTNQQEQNFSLLRRPSTENIYKPNGQEKNYRQNTNTYQKRNNNFYPNPNYYPRNNYMFQNHQPMQYFPPNPYMQPYPPVQPYFQPQYYFPQNQPMQQVQRPQTANLNSNPTHGTDASMSMGNSTRPPTVKFLTVEELEQSPLEEPQLH